MNGEHLTPREREFYESGEWVAERQLTPRQLQVLRLSAKGNTYPEGARILKIKVDTYKTHAERVLVKLGARTMTHAVALGFQRGLLK